MTELDQNALYKSLMIHYVLAIHQKNVNICNVLDNILNVNPQNGVIIKA